MSTYTTGEIAKICGVTVRTVQYYDTRGILVPDELSEGGRRLYSENNLKQMKIICFLRELGLSINAISQLLSEDDPESVLSLLIEQQECELHEEMLERQEKLAKLSELRRELKTVSNFSVESIGDIVYQMENKKKLKKLHWNMLFAGIPIAILQWGSILLWVFKSIWWLFAVYVAVAIPFGILISRYYFKNVEYICPQCHTVFKPKFKEAFWASHTPKTRKLTCPKCNHRSFCVEVWCDDTK